MSVNVSITKGAYDMAYMSANSIKIPHISLVKRFALFSRVTTITAPVIREIGDVPSAVEPYSITHIKRGNKFCAQREYRVRSHMRCGIESGKYDLRVQHVVRGFSNTISTDYLTLMDSGPRIMISSTLTADNKSCIISLRVSKS